MLKLGVPGAGFLPDIGRFIFNLSTGLSCFKELTEDDNKAPLQSRKKAVAPATTVLFVRRKPPFVSESDDSLENESSDIPSNLPPGAIYADLIAPGTIAVLSQPSGATTATMGGLMAMRISKIPAVGVLVDGRVRDVKQLRELIGIPIWCKGNSTVATSAECKAHAMNVPIEIGKTLVCQVSISVNMKMMSRLHSSG